MDACFQNRKDSVLCQHGSFYWTTKYFSRAPVHVIKGWDIIYDSLFTNPVVLICGLCDHILLDLWNFRSYFSVNTTVFCVKLSGTT